MRFEVWGALAVLVWLLGLSWLDYRDHEVPHGVSTVPLLIVGLARVGYPPGVWGQPEALVAGSAVFLTLVAVVFSDVRPLQIAFSVTALVLASQTAPAVLVIVGTWIGALLWTQWGFWGAGDAKVVMILVAIWPDLTLVGALLLALLGGGLLALWQRYGTHTSAALWHVLGELRRGHVPARQDQAEVASWTYRAGVPWLTVGTLAYVVGNLWLS
jgi:hypothetical protein